MKSLARIAALAMAAAAPVHAQDDGASEIIVTSSRMRNKVPPVTTALPYLDKRPVIGLRRAADGAVRHIEIVSDSRDAAMRRSEVQAMLLAALDSAGKDGVSLVTGELEVVAVTRENWRALFPGLAGETDPVDEDDDDDDDEDYDEDDNGKVKPGFEDDGSIATIRLLAKTRLTGTIADAQRRIAAFVKTVPATGRSQIRQSGALALTIVSPEQYRDEVYRRIAKAAQHATTFYGADYKVAVSGLDREIAWAQVSNSEVFLYIPYGFLVSK